MWKNNLIMIMTFSIYIAVSLSGSFQPVSAQEDTQSNISSNSTGIMNNTTGMIDDAFNALKDSFGTFFGGN